MIPLTNTLHQAHWQVKRYASEGLDSRHHILYNEIQQMDGALNNFIVTAESSVG